MKTRQKCYFTDRTAPLLWLCDYCFGYCLHRFVQICEIYYPMCIFFLSDTVLLFVKVEVVFKHILFSSCRLEAQRRFTKSKRGNRSWRIIIGLCGESPKRSRSHRAPLTQTMWTYELLHYIQCSFCDRELLWRPARSGTLKCSCRFEKGPTWFNYCY